jgi:hypothetical protein
MRIWFSPYDEYNSVSLELARELDTYYSTTRYQFIIEEMNTAVENFFSRHEDLSDPNNTLEMPFLSVHELVSQYGTDLAKENIHLFTFTDGSRVPVHIPRINILHEKYKYVCEKVGCLPIFV